MAICSRCSESLSFEFENEETGTIAGTLGEAPDRDACEVLTVNSATSIEAISGTLRMVNRKPKENCQAVCVGSGADLLQQLPEVRGVMTPFGDPVNHES
jgi:hypothetical protein